MDFYTQKDDNGGWPERDQLPTGSPYDDVVEEKGLDIKINEEIANLSIEASYEFLQKNLNFLGLKAQLEAFDNGKCKHLNKYKNIISGTMKFWSCRDCGADLGDI